MTRPLRVLLTVDAVGGIWRAVMDAARAFEPLNVNCLLAGFGPPPDTAQKAECAALTNTSLLWSDAPLDWLTDDDHELDDVAAIIAQAAHRWDADLIHLNLPSQAAGLYTDLPIVVSSHSCLPTWWRAVRGSTLPAEWQGNRRRNAAGLVRADAVIVPSASHGAALETIYGPTANLTVVLNGSAVAPTDEPKHDFILAAGRWWDEGKNGAVLDAAAGHTRAPVLAAGAVMGPNGAAMHFHHVRSSGPLPHEETLALMRRAAIFAAPSRYEPFGLAVVEAARCGAALVLADIPTFRELWDGAAHFISGDDPQAWANAFACLLDDATLRDAMVNAARARAATYTMNRHVEALRDIYRRAVLSQNNNLRVAI